MPTVVLRMRTKRSLASTTLTPLRVSKPGLPVVTGISLISSPFLWTVSRCAAASVTAITRSPVRMVSGFAASPRSRSPTLMPSRLLRTWTVAWAGQ
ncbi:hypothetical protein SALBM217S_04480 [Streptomyces griseoloalbus]